MAETVEVVDNKNGREQNESDNASSQEFENGGSQTDLTKLENDIIRQIEYYFGESNLRRDKFLTQKISEDKEGWVPISVLLTFNRLKAISNDAKVIAEAVEKSSHGLVQVSEDKEKVRRHPENPLPEFNEARRKELTLRTAYAKGFPLDSKMETILEYFNNNYENVENVIMRKYFCQKSKQYLFKGSVFALFEKREQAEEFVKKPELKYGDKELLRYMQEEYLDVKKKEKSKKEEKRAAKKKAAVEAELQADLKLPKNAIVHFAGVEGDISREDIKARVAEIDPAVVVAFIHFERGNKDGEVRFTKDDDGANFLKKLEDGKLKVKNVELSLKMIEGADEEEFLKKALEDMKKARLRSQQLQNRKGKHYKGGHRNDRKRKNEDDGDQPTAKHAKEHKNDNEVAIVAE